MDKATKKLGKYYQRRSIETMKKEVLGIENTIGGEENGGSERVW